MVITAGNEHGDIVDYSSRQLRELVRKMASALRVAGLRKGDRVAGMHICAFKLLMEVEYTTSATIQG